MAEVVSVFSQPPRVHMLEYVDIFIYLQRELLYSTRTVDRYCIEEGKSDRLFGSDAAGDVFVTILVNEVQVIHLDYAYKCIGANQYPSSLTVAPQNGGQSDEGVPGGRMTHIHPCVSSGFK
ncbi:hypothetical protein CBL_05514 [Carabus blaptoides fortunei]